MIFSDQNTAREVRQKAEEQLIDFITDMVAYTVNYDYSEKPTKESLQNYVKNKVQWNMPPLVATLLYKSGIIHAKRRGSDSDYPINLYYDNDGSFSSTGNMTVTQAIKEIPYSLNGGMVDGIIHT